MKISDPKSDWYIPPDWRFILSWHFIVIPTAILASMFLTVISRAVHGDITLLWIAMVIGIVGIVLLFFSRLPLYRQHKFLSFGPRALPAGYRKLYWTAYGFIGTSIAIMALILIALNK